MDIWRYSNEITMSFDTKAHFNTKKTIVFRCTSILVISEDGRLVIFVLSGCDSQAASRWLIVVWLEGKTCSFCWPTLASCPWILALGDTKHLLNKVFWYQLFSNLIKSPLSAKRSRALGDGALVTCRGPIAIYPIPRVSNPFRAVHQCDKVDISKWGIIKKKQLPWWEIDNF